MTRQKKRRQEMSRGRNPAIRFIPHGDEYYIAVYCYATSEHVDGRQSITVFHALHEDSGWSEYEGAFAGRPGGYNSPGRRRSAVYLDAEDQVTDETHAVRARYWFACTQCGAELPQVRHERLVPVLDGIRREGAEEISLVDLAARLR